MKRILYVLVGTLAMGSTCVMPVEPNHVLLTDKKAFTAGTWAKDVSVEWQPPTDRVYAIEEKGRVAVYQLGVRVVSDSVREDSKPFIRLTTDAPRAEKAQLNWNTVGGRPPPAPTGATGTTNGIPVDEETGLPIAMAAVAERIELQSLECELHQHCVLPFRVLVQIGQADGAVVPASEWDVKVEIVGGKGLVASSGAWEKVQ